MKYLTKASSIGFRLFRLVTVFLAISVADSSLWGADEPLTLPKGNSEASNEAANFSEESEPSASSTSATPAGTDKNCLRLFQDFARAAGLKGRNVQHIVATGTFQYGNLDEKRFTLVETREGDRFLELKWGFRGQDYRETLVSKASGELRKRIAKAAFAQDGSRSWKNFFLEEIQNDRVDFREQYGHTVISNGVKLRAKPLDNTQSHVISGRYAELPFQHFTSNYLLLQPFITPGEGQVGYEFLGSKRLPLVKDKEVYEVTHEGEKSFLFDKENSLLLKWSSRGSLAGANVEIAYYATAFSRWGGAIFPSQIKIIANGVAVGVYNIDHVTINGKHDLLLRSN